MFNLSLNNIFRTNNKIREAGKNPLLILLFLSLMSLLIVKGGVLFGYMFLIIPVVLIFLGLIFINPYHGLISIFIFNYFAMGIYRYIPEIQWGLMMDVLIVLTYISLILKSIHTPVNWKNARNDLTFLALIWMLYAIMQIFNPHSTSLEHWFLGVRTVSMHFLFIVPLVLILLNRFKDVNRVLNLFAVFTIMGAVKGFIQYKFGFDFAEYQWLESGGKITHLIYSGTRYFSFFTDAGQFGASMGFSSVVFFIAALSQPHKGKKIYYFFVSALAFAAMFISGTRGAIFVPLAGFGYFIFLSKQKGIIILGTIMLLSFFVMLKYTNIGSGNQFIYRMRTAFDRNDASFQTRLTNQEKVASFMQDKPFGAGIGNTRAGSGNYISTVPPDSWYVMIWMEQGIIGLMLYLSIMAYALFKGSYIAMFKVKDPQLSIIYKGILSGFAGILLASYGNPILGQFPQGIIIYMLLAFVFNWKMIEADKKNNEKNTSTLSKSHYGMV